VGQQTLPQATIADTARAMRDVLFPLVAQGAIIRRPRACALAERLGADARALRRLRHLRDRYGDGPLLLRLPGRRLALVLAADDVHRLLEGTPLPFSAATSEKVAALRHFQPHAVLVSDPPLRDARRYLNEKALESDHPIHSASDTMLRAVQEELADLGGQVGWNAFREVWSRAVRRVVLGDSARDDTELTALLDALRADANWAQFHRRATATRRRFEARLRLYVARAEPGSLVAALPEADDVDPAGQVPHWLFAFDSAGIALWRTLAVLAVHPEIAAPLIDEARATPPPPLLPRSSAAVLESVRLWPTTMVVLRQSTETTEWRGRIAPAGTEFAIVSSAFHRDDQALPFAHRFEPEIWLEGRADQGWPLIPFSGGPAVCPGRNVVLLTTSAAIRLLIAGHRIEADPATERKLAGAMPMTFDHTAPRLTFQPLAR